LIAFWSNLKQGHDLFEKTHRLPIIKTRGDGTYEFVDKITSRGKHDSATMISMTTIRGKMPRLALVGVLSIAACAYAQTDAGGLELIARIRPAGFRMLLIHLAQQLVELRFAKSSVHEPLSRCAASRAYEAIR